jgi:hypothetical protein
MGLDCRQPKPGNSSRGSEMPRRKPFNSKIVQSNLGEAIAQLRKLERKAADGKLREGAMQIGLLHAYHHLNFAWNVRRISTSEYSNLTPSQFERWGKYPVDIEGF